MFMNWVAKIFHKCQRAVRAQNLHNGALNQVDTLFPRYLNGWHNIGFTKRGTSVRIVNIIDLENMSTIARQKLTKLPELVKQQLRQSVIVELLKQHMLLKIPMLKQQSVNTVRIWAQQCECVIAQRIRRGQQIFSLYTKIWEERALREIVRHLSRRGRDVLLASSVAAIFDWEMERISDDVMAKHMGDIEYVYKLQESTMTCSQCGLRLLIDSACKHTQYCRCAKNSVSRQRKDHLAEWEESAVAPGTKGEWQPFIERQDVTVWRQEHQEHGGLFLYKVYGRYDDVIAKDFLQVQLDTKFRKEWDATALELTVLDSETSTGSEVLYWEMAWPRFFANRDYVFKRRSLVDTERKRIVIRSESTQHPSCPPRSGLHRVTEYWSFMVIKPITDLENPGIEFSLTYFDNPGLSIPSPVSAWVAISGLPDFLGRLRDAARLLRNKREEMHEHETSTPTKPPPSAPQNLTRQTDPSQDKQTLVDSIPISPTSRLPFFLKLCSNSH